MMNHPFLKKFLIFLFLFLVGCENKFLGSMESKDFSSIQPDEILSSKPLNSQFGDRYFIKSVLDDIFLPLPKATSSSEDDTIKLKIQTLVTQQPMSFGGICSKADEIYEAGKVRLCNTTVAANLTKPQNNVSRQGYKVRVCQEIVQINKSIINALAKINMSPTTAIDTNRIELAFQLFYPGQNLTENQKSNFDDLLKSLGNETNLNKWRMIFSSLCQSTGWETI